jgi:hypothetical protein
MNQHEKILAESSRRNQRPDEISNLGAECGGTLALLRGGLTGQGRDVGWEDINSPMDPHRRILSITHRVYGRLGLS